MAEVLQEAAEIADARKERNFYQLERDKVERFWQIAKEDLERRRLEMQNLATDVQEQEESHAAEIRVYAQKIRYLQYEHKLHIQAEQERAQAALADAVTAHRETIAKHLGDRTEAAQGTADGEALQIERIAALRRNHDSVLQLTNADGKKLLREQAEKQEKKLAVLADDLELRRKAELHDLEERANEHIQLLVERHQTAFTDMKKYYNRITANNLDLISTLKAELAAMRRNEHYNSHLMADIQAENARLKEPLTRAKKDVSDLRAQLLTLGKDRQSLRMAQSRLTLLESKHRALEAEHTAKEAEFAALQQKRDALLESFEPSLRGVAARAAHRNRALQKRLAAVERAVDATDSQVKSVLTASGLPDSVVADVSLAVTASLAKKDRVIKDLHFELTKCAKAHLDVIKGPSFHMWKSDRCQLSPVLICAATQPFFLSTPAYEAKCVGAAVAPLNLEESGLLSTTIMPPRERELVPLQI